MKINKLLKIRPFLILIFLTVNSCTVEESLDSQEEVSQNIESDSNSDSNSTSNSNSNLPSLVDNLDFETILNTIDSECTSIFFIKIIGFSSLTVRII